MKFTPKHIDENVNVSKTHPLAELAWLVGGMLLLALVFYLALGVTADLAVAKIPIKAEVWLGEHFVDSFEANEDEPLRRRLQTLLDNLPAESPLHKYTFTVQLVKNEEVNALALPGGHIVVFSALVKQAESENELAMVLAHELGHFAHRDHLKRLGRGLGLTVAAMLVFGEDSAISRLMSNLFLVTESSYSRQQEADADRFGLELLVNSYGHAGGAIDFFARVGKKAGRRAPYLLASHPHPDDRIEELQSLIRENGYSVEIITPLGDDLLGETEPEQEPETAVDK
ncbi:MAG: M48 family metallopeptidase [Desulfuromonadales bacterium]|nr:M48 family metallopeptidase [Desulfuromonadales bacterium]MDH3807077.1 M48 family metallopeptidase [Desulfuromonadales bacterium]MDH3868296.1 M48 family metallopeptidase [Desulfuromonadales bacterium]MDH3959878.1 M48 family metallopeptidase [Desulfuromonadales bacterium]MDH4024128.1 M48 family metallopeptidase [Desulfuromonadales bacterium]